MNTHKQFHPLRKWLSFMMGVVLMIGGYHARAQEFTKELLLVSDEHSKIVEIGADQQLLFNYHNGANYFTEVASTSTSYPSVCIRLDGVEVLDFEAIDQMVYFCGKRDSDAILGSFKLPISMAPATMNYQIVPEFKSFNKLALHRNFKIMDTIKVELLGTLNDGAHTIVDASPISTGWLFLSAPMKKNVRLDDIIVNDTDIVVSYHRVDSLKGGIFFIPTSATIGSLPTYYNAEFREFSSDVVGGVLLGKCQNGYFVAASQSILIGLYNFEGFNGRFPMYAGYIWHNELFNLSYSSIKDLCYSDTTNKTLEVLINTKVSGIERSEIYHIKPTVLNGYSTIRRSIFPKVWLNSIEHRSDLSDYFVASGHAYGNTESMYYQYLAGSGEKNCTEYKETTFSLSENNFSGTTIKLPVTLYYATSEKDEMKIALINSITWCR